VLQREGLRERALLLWNANNDFGFERVDWKRLQQAATICTVSRYMRHRMWRLGVDPIALPNGIEPEAFAAPSPWVQAELARRTRGRLLLAKVARWDPSKRWLFAIDAALELKRAGQKPLLIARGGIESHEGEVLDRCRAHGLRFTERADSSPGARGLLELLSGLDDVDVLVSRSHLDSEARSLLFSVADGVLANSGHEPFGLVGLEAMAVGGVACTGSTGEEYAQDGLNALVLQTNDARELVSLLHWLRSSPQREDELRAAARATATEYSWERILDRVLLPRLDALMGTHLSAFRCREHLQNPRAPRGQREFHLGSLALA
jgi:glycosyltransferase involved in cell wall biosynthesis